jgi:multiple sugar transport system ATP-binding protein
LKLKLQHLSKEFETPRGSVFAVKDVHFETAENEFFVLLGPSGCGKSTLLNLIAGLETPTGGEIWFDDKLVASSKRGVFLGPKQRNIAMVFQSYALYPHMSIFDNIAFPLKISKEKDEHIREAVNRVASMLGIAHLLSSKPGELSGGQRQRVAIGRAIVRHPAIFLLDEPLSNLDAQLRTSTRAELKSLQQQLGTTTIYVTHDQVEAMSLGNRIALLRDGRMVQIGTAEELYEKPANAFVARFIGSPPMNLLQSHLFRIDEALFVGIGGQEIGPVPAEGLKRFAPGEYILGIRPEHISIQQGRTGGKAIRSQSFSVDPLGREVLLQVRIEAQDAAVLTEERRYAESKAGTHFDLVFDFGKAHLFEKGGEQRALFSP